MNEIIERIFAELKSEIEKGSQLELYKLPEIEEDLRPFVIRELTEEENRFLTVRAQKNREARQMYFRIGLLTQIEEYAATDETRKDDEILRFHAETIDNLFFWYLAIQTNWEFSMLVERRDPVTGQNVLIGLKPEDARAYVRRVAEREQRDMEEAQAIAIPTSRVN